MDINCIFMLVLGTFIIGVRSRLSQPEAIRMDQFMTEVMRCARIPAASLALVSNGEVAYTNGYGTANQNTNIKTGSDTAFCLGAGTQTFTATLLAKLLANQKNYTWETPITEILGIWVRFQDTHRTKNINLKDILAMRTGYGNLDIIPIARAMGRYRLISNIRFTPEIANFREKFIQSDLLFVLVEEVIRDIGDDTFEKLLRKHVLEPIGITRPLFLSLEERLTNDFAGPVMSYNRNPYSIPFSALKGFEVIGAGTALCLSANDMAKWLLFNLEDGLNTDGREVMDKKILGQLFEPWMFRTEDAGPRSRGFEQPDIQVSYTKDSNTLGWIKGHYRGYPTFTQGGDLPGYESQYSIIPGRAVGVHTAIVGDNSLKAYAAKSLINIFALDMLIHGAPWFNARSVCKIMDDMTEHLTKLENATPSPTVHKSAEPQRPLDSYIGEFRHLALGDLRILRNESEFLHLKYGSYGNFIMHPTFTKDVFILESVPGSMWYFTHMDIFRTKGPCLAIFNSSFTEDKIESVYIPNFDTHTKTVFTRNLVIPEPQEEINVCGTGCKLFTPQSAWSIILMIFLAFNFRIYSV
ncbi:hypothetical protein LOTGIDRAFT_160712 [Lottia gigantea]|uniref:Beta-lactamase-related domain-containing protein n=1 Tax=Lottia gigantea TaxID=225164 RepID=V3ZU11_LOTGI|nr:hypothetical protein LOTGIDRAFT_160712 [Lottia gigantea]ESO94958.1 hypothetical protein LOTGIDRAFT_160712 [Lottia gigantea]